MQRVNETAPCPAEAAQIPELLLGALTFSSGAIDAISFLALGKVFTAFMTGNVAFLALRVAGSTIAPLAGYILASMVGFAAGAYAATRIATLSKENGTWPQRATYALGASLIAHAGFLAAWFANGGRPPASVIPLLLALWGLAMGMQTAAVRTLNVAGVFTTARPQRSCFSPAISPTCPGRVSSGGGWLPCWSACSSVPPPERSLCSISLSMPQSCRSRSRSRQSVRRPSNGGAAGTVPRRAARSAAESAARPSRPTRDCGFPLPRRRRPE